MPRGITCPARLSLGPSLGLCSVHLYPTVPACSLSLVLHLWVLIFKRGTSKIGLTHSWVPNSSTLCGACGLKTADLVTGSHSSSEATSSGRGHLLSASSCLLPQCADRAQPVTSPLFQPVKPQKARVCQLPEVPWHGRLWAVDLVQCQQGG